MNLYSLKHERLIGVKDKNSRKEKLKQIDDVTFEESSSTK
jgi:hypothetical protein